MRRQRSIFTIFELLLLSLSFVIPGLCNADDGPKPPSPSAVSHVRVVRLSFLEGTVTVRKPESTEWVAASVNTPIEEGFSVATDKKSFAEVQFENGSTVWLGELSSIDFTQLALTPHGGHVNHLTLDGGYATFRLTPQHSDEYLLNASGVTLAPDGKTEFRADVNQDRMRVEVFNGHVRATAGNQSENLAKNHSLVRDVNSAAPLQVTDKIEKDDWDKWTDARKQQSNLAYNDQAVGPASPFYGWDDLDVYGAWGYFPGYGNAWAPYEPLGWSPYSAGMWDSYPGLGLTWISAEPWGWLPFHYGFWNFDAGMGWFWMPGSFNAWNPALVNWYSGPGWVGWAPVGPAGIGGRPPCTLGAAGCLTAVPPTTLRNGEPIAPGNPHLVHPSSSAAITATSRPDFVPNRSTIVSSQTSSARLAAASGFTRSREAAPSSIIMGRQVGVEGLTGHHSAFRSGEPVRVQLGSTMGGKFAVPAANGGNGRSAMAGRDPHGVPGASSIVRPQILPRGSAGSLARGVGGLGPTGGSASAGATTRGSAGQGASSGTSAGSHGAGTSAGASGGGGHH